MKNTNELVDFFQIAEKLECEYRLTRMSNGEKQAVASHSWNMIMMAIALRPYLKTPVNMERVLELCALHDLPESIAHDIPLHQQTPDVKAQKHINEQRAINKINILLQDKRIMDRFGEYELRQSPESKLVKLLDILDTCVQHMCTQELSYIGQYNDNFYWRAFFADSFANQFDYEPMLRGVFDEIRERVAARLKQELNIDYSVFIKGKNEQ